MERLCTFINSWIVKKKTLYQATQYFPKPYVHFGGNVEVELDLSNYETKVGLKGAARVDTSNLAAKSD